MRTRSLLAVLALTAACKKDPVEEPSPLLDVAETERFTLPGLEGEAYVLRTEANIPHIYAANRTDLGRAHGFVAARDRFFAIDFYRRSGLATLSGILGDAAFDLDAETIQVGTPALAEMALTQLDRDPELGAFVDAFAEGINTYIDAVKNGDLPVPTEYDLTAGILGADDPEDLMEPFSRRDIAGAAATLIYFSGFETTDLGRARAAARAETMFDGAPDEALREAGLWGDIWEAAAPPMSVRSAPDFVVAPYAAPAAAAVPGAPPAAKAPQALVERAAAWGARFEERLGHDRLDGWGSNAWAVSAAHTADGRAVMAGDGHLSLSLPTIVWQVGLDTAHLGGEGGYTHRGMTLSALPFLLSGTNGNVAWSSTQLMGDITDWYTDEIQLDGAGLPSATRFGADWKPIRRESREVFVRGVPLFGPERTESVDRWITWDGRTITEIEGRRVGGPEEAGAGEVAVRLKGDWIVPADTDGDDKISAISFAYTGLQVPNLLGMLDSPATAQDLDDMEALLDDVVALSQNFIAIDSKGSAMYSAFQGTPCRGHLPRDASGRWLDGADPRYLIDGTRYAGFTLPANADGTLIHGGEGSSCILSYDQVPHSRDPAQGYLFTANNDPGGHSLDDSLTNDAHYIGGPWIEGYRADAIDRDLAAAVAEGTANVAKMGEIQGDHTSTLGRQFADDLVAAIDHCDADDAPAAVQALCDANTASFADVHDRITAWIAAGWQADSGVVTFYDDGGDPDNAVATMIFNAWLARFVNGAMGDEGFDGLWYPTGGTGTLRLFTQMVDGRGPGNPLGLAQWSPDTMESVYWDHRYTEGRETSEQIALQALVDAIAFLEGPQESPGFGGFGTTDRDAWRWGLRHHVRFPSMLLEALGDEFGFLVSSLTIDPSRFPVADGLSAGDPRYDLPGFPRPGDHLGIDAGDPGLGGTRFDYDSGPVFRMAISLGPDGMAGQNVLPGGQSGLVDDPYYDDQAKLWLGNEAIPMWFEVDEVIAAATGRETLTP